jgi:hypothetical protein
VCTFAAESGQAGRFQAVRQIRKKENPMKKQMLVASLCLILGLAGAPTYAQADGLRAKVPFNFVAFGKTFLAGEYVMIARSHQLSIRDAQGRMIGTVLANEISRRSAGANAELVFHCYRERCFLAEVWSPTQENGKQLPVSRTEAGLAKEETRKDLAVLGEKPAK